MTLKEAAKACGRHPETIKRWIRSGKLKAHKETERGGDGWQITEADLIACTRKRIITPEERRVNVPVIEPAITLSQAIRIKAYVEMIIDILLEGAE